MRVYIEKRCLICTSTFAEWKEFVVTNAELFLHAEVVDKVNVGDSLVMTTVKVPDGFKLEIK